MEWVELWVKIEVYSYIIGSGVVITILAVYVIGQAVKKHRWKRRKRNNR